MLEGRVVLDCTDQLGWLAGRILADLGADVIKLDPPGTDRANPGWLAYNINKRPLDLDVTTPEGQRRLDALVAHADIVIASYRPGGALAAIFDYRRLCGLNPAIIVVAVTAFGLTGPRSQWKASDIELMASSGAMSLAGEPDGAPRRVSVAQSYPWTGAHAAVGALIALHHRNASGCGQLVDVSGQASAVLAVAYAPTFWDLERTEPTRAGTYMTGRSVSGARYRVFWPCRDGYLNFILYGGHAGRHSNEQIVCWMREAGMDLGALAQIDWTRFQPTRASQEEVDAIETPLLRFFATLTKREFLAGAHERGMLGYPVSSVADIAADPQLHARAYWQEAPGPDGVRRRFAGCFAVIDGERPRLRTFALEGGGDGTSDAVAPGTLAAIRRHRERVGGVR
jgi:crotonobetainyl-CoA:carnitine CoA-transferase CaiB-like acyl-CoA transferase